MFKRSCEESVFEELSISGERNQNVVSKRGKDSCALLRHTFESVDEALNGIYLLTADHR